MAGAIRFFVNCSVLNASSTRMPRIRSMTSRAFCGETRVNCAFALNSMRISTFSKFRLRLRRCRSNGPRSARYSGRLGCDFRRRFHRVPLELPREGELAQLVAHHVFRSEEHTSELQSHSFISYAV